MNAAQFRVLGGILRTAQWWLVSVMILSQLGVNYILLSMKGDGGRLQFFIAYAAFLCFVRLTPAWHRSMLTLPLAARDLGEVIWAAVFGLPGLLILGLDLLAIGTHAILSSRPFDRWSVLLLNVPLTFGVTGWMRYAVLYLKDRGSRFSRRRFADPNIPKKWMMRARYAVFMPILILIFVAAIAPGTIIFGGIPLREPYIQWALLAALIGAAGALTTWIKREEIVLSSVMPVVPPGVLFARNGPEAAQRWFGWRALTRKCLQYSLGANIFIAALYLAGIILSARILGGGSRPDIFLERYAMTMSAYLAAAVPVWIIVPQMRVMRLLPVPRNILMARIFLTSIILSCASAAAWCGLVYITLSPVAFTAFIGLGPLLPALWAYAILTVPLIIHFGNPRAVMAWMLPALIVMGSWAAFPGAHRFKQNPLPPLALAAAIAIVAVLWTDQALKAGRRGYRNAGP